MESKEVYISEGNRPLWQRILAAAFLTAAIVCVLVFFDVLQISDSLRNAKRSAAMLQLFIICASQGIAFSVVRDYHFNFTEKKYKIEYCVGPIHFGTWKYFKNLEYVSVFKKEDYYEINLWYNKNKRFNISNTNDPLDAFEAGKVIAKKLQLDIIDARDPHNSERIIF